MDDWSGLEVIDPTLVKALKAYFPTAYQVSTAFDDLDGARELVDEALGNSYGAARREAISRAVLGWQEGLTRKFNSWQLTAYRERVMFGKQLDRTGDKVSMADSYDAIVSGSPILGLAALESRLAKKARTSTTARADAEDLSKKKWALALAEYITEAKLPAVASFSGMANVNTAWIRAFGARRSKTLRNRAKSWKRVREWRVATTGQPWPTNVADLLQYLDERNEVQPMGKTVPTSIHSTLSLLELVGQVPTELRLSSDRLWVESVKSWTSDLSRDAPPKKQAELYTVAIALSSELVLGDVTAPIGQRFYAFVLLLLLWGTMRCDDLQNVDPSSLELSQLGLKFILRRTKTSGPGKPVGELHGFVARDISLSGVDWLKLGLDLLDEEELRFQRDFFAIYYGKDWTDPGRDYLEPEGLATMLRTFLLTLPVVARRGSGLVLNQASMLISPEMASFWTGHSARHTLPSWAAAAGIAKEDRDYLGRWSYAKHGSQDYVLTSRQIVHRVQRQVCRFLLEGQPSPGLVEEELIERVKAFAVRVNAGPLTTARRHNVLVWSLNLGAWHVGGTFPRLEIGPVMVGMEDAPEQNESGPQGEDSLPEAPYFITISRKTHFRRLHVSKSCAVRQERCLVTQPIYNLTGDVADAICKLCKPKLKEGNQVSSSSESSSSS